MKKKTQIFIAYLISCLIHIALLFFVIWHGGGNPVVSKEVVMEVDLKEEKNWQIADIMQPKEEKVPEKAKHKGLYDSSVKEETVSSSFERAPGRPETRGGEGMKKLKKDAEKLGLSSGREVIRLKPEQMAERGVGEDNSGGKIPQDFFVGYKRGVQTNINVLKCPDVAYAVRLKRVFKLAWDPFNVLYRRFLAGQLDKKKIQVVVNMSVSRTGELMELYVTSSSGFGDYDNEAIRAVRVSAPFSSPPAKILDKDGVLRMSWTFVTYTG